MPTGFYSLVIWLCFVDCICMFTSINKTIVSLVACIPVCLSSHRSVCLSDNILLFTYKLWNVLWYETRKLLLTEAVAEVKNYFWGQNQQHTSQLVCKNNCFITINLFYILTLFVCKNVLNIFLCSYRIHYAAVGVNIWFYLHSKIFESIHMAIDLLWV